MKKLKINNGDDDENFFENLFGFKEMDAQGSRASFSSSYEQTRDRLLSMAEFHQHSSMAPFWMDREECIFQWNQQQQEQQKEDVRPPSMSAGIFSFPQVSDLRRQVEHILNGNWAMPIATTTTTTSTESEIEGRTNITSISPHLRGRIRLTNVVGEARTLHMKIPKGSVVQAASQFNLLEFPSPHTIPETGISAYRYDPTQGPACAMAAVAGTVYRNYLVPLPWPTTSTSRMTTGTTTTTTMSTSTNGSEEDEEVGIQPTPSQQRQGQQRPPQRGQTHDHQLNGLSDIEDYLWEEMKGRNLQPTPPFWQVKNGYTDSTTTQLESLNKLLSSTTSTGGITEDDNDKSSLEEKLISRLRIGVQEDTTITDDPTFRHTVTQTYNSALSIGYSHVEKPSMWEPLARLVLKGTYEATILVGLLKALESKHNSASSDLAKNNTTPMQPSDTSGTCMTPAAEESPTNKMILLTKVGGGVFGNHDSWIIEAIDWAMKRIEPLVERSGVDLEVQIVHFRRIDSKYRVLERGHG